MKRNVILIIGTLALCGCQSGGRGTYSSSMSGSDRWSVESGVRDDYEPPAIRRVEPPRIEFGAGPVETQMSAADQLFAQRIRAMLSEETAGATATPTVSSESLSNLRIITRDGVVLLRGRAATDREKRAIIARVQELAGVKTVQDEITVGDDLDDVHDPDPLRD